MKKVDWTGRRLGRITVEKFLGTQYRGTRWRRVYLCRCECGVVKAIPSDGLYKVKSCGCVAAEKCRKRSTKHGATSGYNRIPEYGIWLNAKNRVRNKNLKDYHRYGGRGIGMCSEWWNDFAAFLSHVGPRPGPQYSIDRINPDGDYEPGNVRWVTAKEQANNRSNSKARVKLGDRQGL